MTILIKAKEAYSIAEEQNKNKDLENVLINQYMEEITNKVEAAANQGYYVTIWRPENVVCGRPRRILTELLEEVGYRVYLTGSNVDFYIDWHKK